MPADGYFRIERIYSGHAWHDGHGSPLAEPGVQASVGDYILAVDDVSTKGVENFYRLLENKGGQIVKLSLASDPSLKFPREVLVRTISRETDLRYIDWVESRRRMVDELSDGRVLANTIVRGCSLTMGPADPQRPGSGRVNGMTGGRGFIALAAMIFGRWHPVGAVLAALLFGYADTFRIMFETKIPIPSQFVQMLPYVLAILVLVGMMGKAKAPAADGIPYEPEE